MMRGNEAGLLELYILFFTSLKREISWFPIANCEKPLYGFKLLRNKLNALIFLKFVCTKLFSLNQTVYLNCLFKHSEQE